MIYLVIMMKNRINSILEEQAQTKYWLAQQTESSYSTIFKLCSNKTSSISFDLLESICIALNCTPNDIFVFTKERK